MSNGYIYGADRVPTLASASGLWTPEDVRLAMLGQKWPLGNLRVEVGSFTKQASAGTQDIAITTNLTGAPAGSWAVIFWTAGSDQASGTWDGGILSVLGFVANGGGSISQYAVAVTSDDGAATASNSARRMAAAAITLPSFDGSSYLWNATFVSFPTATSMRLNWDTNNGGSEKINYAIISGLTGAKVVNWTTSTSAGSKSVTGVGFPPDLVLHASTWNTALGSSTHARLGFGVMNKHGQQWANALASDDNLADSNTSRWQQTDACLLSVDASESAGHQVHFSSMDADGFTTYFSTTGGVTQQVASLCLDGISSKIGAFTKTATGSIVSQTVDTRQGFVPKGLLSSNVLQTPSGAPGAHATWSLGATDLTNSRVASLSDDDASATTEADSYWSNSQVFHAGFGPDDYMRGALSSIGDDTVSISWNSGVGGSGYEVLYLLLGDSGTETFPQQINTPAYSSSATTTAYSNQKKAVELSDGSIIAVGALDTTSTAAYFFRRANGVWTDYGSVSRIAGWSNGSIAAYVDSGGTERLVAVWKQSGTGGGRVSGTTYVMVGTFSSDRTTLTWGTAVQIFGAGLDDYPDVVAHAEGTGGQAHMVGSYLASGPYNSVLYARISITSGGVPSVAGTQEISSSYGINAHLYPSIDYDPSTKRLFVAWSAGTTGSGKGIRFRTASYSAGSWTWATEVEVDNTRYINSTSRWLNCRWDGTRVIIGGWLQTATGQDIINWESSNFTSFGDRTHAASTGAAIGTGLTLGSMAIDQSTGDIYFYGCDGSVTEIVYYKFTRSGAAFGTRKVLDVGIGTSPYVYAFPITGGIGWIYTAGNNSPYSVKYDRLQLG